MVYSLELQFKEEVGGIDFLQRPGPGPYISLAMAFSYSFLDATLCNTARQKWQDKIPGRTPEFSRSINIVMLH